MFIVAVVNDDCVPRIFFDEDSHKAVSKAVLHFTDLLIKTSDDEDVVSGSEVLQNYIEDPLFDIKEALYLLEELGPFCSFVDTTIEC